MTNRQLLIVGGALCITLLGFGYFLQYGRHIEPCPLCILQRLAFMALGTTFLIGAMIGSGRLGTRLVAAVALLFAGLGGGVAGRQVWLQSLPADAVPACGPGLDYMIGNFPLLKTLSMVLRGSGECAENTWQFLGLGIAAWALLWFAMLGLLALRLLLRPSDGT